MLAKALTTVFILLSAASCLSPNPGAEQVLPRPHSICTNCHSFANSTGKVSLIYGPLSDKTCLACHPDRISQGEHKVGVKAKDASLELPLSDGNIICITCHEPHGLSPFPSLLRLPPKDLCIRCHNK